MWVGACVCVYTVYSPSRTVTIYICPCSLYALCRATLMQHSTKCAHLFLKVLLAWYVCVHHTVFACCIHLFNTRNKCIVLVQFYVLLIAQVLSSSGWCVVNACTLCTQCKDLVDKYTKELIQFIESKLPPDEMCEVRACVMGRQALPGEE